MTITSSQKGKVAPHSIVLISDRSNFINTAPTNVFVGAAYHFEVGMWGQFA